MRIIPGQCRIKILDALARREKMRLLSKFWNWKKSTFTLKFYNNITKTGTELQRLSKKYKFYNIYYLQIDKIDKIASKCRQISLLQLWRQKPRVNQNFRKLNCFVNKKPQCVWTLFIFGIFHMYKNYYCEIMRPQAQRPWRRCDTCAMVNPDLTQATTDGGLHVCVVLDRGYM